MSDLLVLITDAFTHLGFRTLVSTLKAGHCVIAIIQNEEQIKKIASKPSVTPYGVQLNFSVVKDVTAPGAFEHCMKGATHVIHNAELVAPPAPQAGKGKQRQQTMTQRFYDPARRGTLSVLGAASRAPTVRRVVMISSVLILKPSKSEFGTDPYDVFTSTRSEIADAFTERKAFSNSKIIAYETALAFAKQRKPNFDLVHVLPGYMQGASELYETAEDMKNDFNEATIEAALGKINGTPKMIAQVLLHDVAGVLVLALDTKAVRSMENLVVVSNHGQGASWDDIAAIVARFYPKEVQAGVLNPIKGQKDLKLHFDVRTSEKAWGNSFADPVWIVRSVVDQYLELLGKDK